MSEARGRRLDALEGRLAGIEVPKALADVFSKAASLTPSQAAADVLRVRLSGPQAEVLDSPARFRLLIAGRRFGKSYLSCAAAVIDALRGPGRVCWIVSPTFRQARDVNWATLRRLVPAGAVAGAPRETDLSVTLKNGSVIALRSGDEPDLLRGSGLDLVVLDEAAQLTEDLWSVVLRPALADREGGALFCTTPRGMSHWLFDRWQGAEGDGAWQRWQFPTVEGLRVSAAELEQAAQSMSRAEYAQEFEASFESAAGRVYQDFRLEPWPHGNVDASADDPGGDVPVLVGLDPGMNYGLVLGTLSPAGDVLIFDARTVKDSHTAAIAAELQRRFPGRRVLAYPDPAGQQRRSSAGSLTDHIILRHCGFTVLAPAAAPRVADRVNVLRSLVLAADGRRRLRIHPRAHELVRALDSQQFDVRTEAPEKKSGADHIVDALGYLVWSAANPLHTHRTWTESVQIGHGGLVFSPVGAGECSCFGCRHDLGSCALG